MSAYIQANILIILHPFIPFFTEKVWQDFQFKKYFKSPLMYKKWDLEPKSNFNKSYKKIDWLIEVIQNIRSTKVTLGVSPGEFIDISNIELSLSKVDIIKDNLNVFKRLARVTEFNNLKSDKNGVKIIVGGETLILYFNKSLDLNEQKQKISIKVNLLNQKVAQINNKLNNKSFLKNAPKQIIQNEKKALIDYNIELKKLNSILNSIKN